MEASVLPPMSCQVPCALTWGGRGLRKSSSCVRASFVCPTSIHSCPTPASRGVQVSIPALEEAR